MQLAFAGAEVALDATVIEVVPPLPENDSRLDHPAMACAHTLPSHSATITTPPFYRRKLPFRVVARLDLVIYVKARWKSTRSQEPERPSKTVFFISANPQAVRERLLVTATESGVDV